MQNILLVIHLLVCLALIVTILLQRSEGGALGIGGGGGGGLVGGRSAAHALARITMVLAAVFFVTSLTLTALNALAARAPTGVERVIFETESLNRNKAAEPVPEPEPPAPEAPEVAEPAEPASQQAPPEPAEPAEPASQQEPSDEPEPAEPVPGEAQNGLPHAPTLKSRAGDSNSSP